MKPNAAAMLLEALSRASRAEALAYTARRPYENAFLGWVLEGGRPTVAGEEIVLVRSEDGALAGVAFFGAQLVFTASDERAIDAVAAEMTHHRDLRSCVGAQTSVARLWERIRTWHREPILARHHQPVYVIDRVALAPPPAMVADVRRAGIGDLELVIEHSARMMLGELGYDPRRNRSAFAAGIRRTIGAGNWWVWIVDGELRFTLNVGARTRQTAQLQGVWTPPELRGRGYAFAALHAIASRLLGENPTLSLYVNDFNLAAIALYERVGFTRDGEMATLLFT